MVVNPGPETACRRIKRSPKPTEPPPFAESSSQQHGRRSRAQLPRASPTVEESYCCGRTTSNS